ncbi:MAG: hypothetical protein J0G32_00570 [Alphaproteobacteria bacterium]|nr:hypothetical protein [Alphaproteobacteria bacterium]OJV17243.1 MAG: hypothetical protein BGO27_06170 [Alphaproteobacteria bacterium 33-17]
MIDIILSKINNLAVWACVFACLLIVCFYLMKFSLKKYYRHIYHKHGIEGFQKKYGKISKIFAKPDEILGLKKRTAEYYQELESQKDMVYMQNYQEYVNQNTMYKDDAQIVGINDPIGPMTEKIHRERGGRGMFGFNINKFMSGYWVNYVMMGKEGQRGKGNDGQSR